MPCPDVQNPAHYLLDDSSIIFPLSAAEAEKVEIVTGPNIVPFPDFTELPEDLSVEVILKTGDNISTDAIMPAGSKVLPFRSNIPAISRFVFEQLDPGFAERAAGSGAGAVIGGENYGQGSSREHAALAPRYLGIRLKIAKSFARIHKANLINFGIVPLAFKDPDDYALLDQGQKLLIPHLRTMIVRGATIIPVEAGERTFLTILDISDRQRRELLAGGALNYVKTAGKWEEEPHGCL
jgi:aconitate hydratase